MGWCWSIFVVWSNGALDYCLACASCTDTHLTIKSIRYISVCPGLNSLLPPPPPPPSHCSTSHPSPSPLPLVHLPPFPPLPLHWSTCHPLPSHFWSTSHPSPFPPTGPPLTPSSPSHAGLPVSTLAVAIAIPVGVILIAIIAIIIFVMIIVAYRNRPKGHDMGGTRRPKGSAGNGCIVENGAASEQTRRTDSFVVNHGAQEMEGQYDTLNGVWVWLSVCLYS